jgi:hypothetical protein
MAKKYVAVRMPVEAYNNLNFKKRKIEKVVRQITNKKINIPLTKIIIAVSENPINLTDDYVLKLAKRKRVIKCIKIKEDS